MSGDNGLVAVSLAVPPARPRQGSTASCVSEYLQSFQHYTQEALPREHNYDVTALYKPHRPSIHKLLFGEKAEEASEPQGEDGDTLEKKKGKIIKFGWLEGVYMRCLLNIWGVMLFLRLSWVIGQAGVGLGIVIIIVSNLVTVITSISMSAVCTNGQIKAGGIYYMISRSLGPEFGASIGLMFTLSNSVACAMYVVGFCESLLDLLEYLDIPIPIIDGGINDTRIIGAGTLVVLLLIAWIGMDWVTRTQMMLLVVLIAAQIDYIVGCFMGPQSDDEVAKGMVGFDLDTLKDNFKYKWRPENGVEQGFFEVFAVFFPAVTGIVAGANLSGDLKDPSTAIPKGTLLAIGTTFVTYVVYALFFGATMERETTGDVDDLDTESLTYCRGGNVTCEWGLYNAQAMSIASAWDGLIYAGCFAATLSSAIASLVGAPRVLQALAADKLYPYVGFFAKGRGANNDPIRGYLLCFVIALGCIAIGKVNVVATITTTIFLTAYGLINFSVFHASITRSPGWRPSFQYYNAWVSLLGTVMCLVVMFLINWWLSLITFGAVIALYLLAVYMKPDVNWGSSTQAQVYVNALKSVHELLRVEEHVKNYRPQVLVLCGVPSHRPPLLHMAKLLTKDASLLVAASVEKPGLSQMERSMMSNHAYFWLKRHKINSFFHFVESQDFSEGTKALYQLTGMGRLRPNVVLMGYKGDWQICSKEKVNSYFQAIHDALDMCLAISILRVPEGLDYKDKIEEVEVNKNDTLSSLGKDESLKEVQSSYIPSTSKSNKAKPRKRKVSASELYTAPGGGSVSKDVLHSLTRFQRQQSQGYIDVWWLYDDGGLTLLLPYILTTRSKFQYCSLRIFALADKKEELAQEQRNLAILLNKFRIGFSDVMVIPDIGKRAHPDNKMIFDNMVKKFKVTSPSDNDGITEEELKANKEKTNRHLRLRELLLHYSKHSNMIIMTLPMPRPDMVSPLLYMAWLETVSKDMPPFLFVRGNQKSVLTFYS